MDFMIFGQDFIQTIQQIEVYKGANGAHFGPSAIAGAINFVTDIDYVNNYSINSTISEHILKNNSFDANYTNIMDNDWHINIKLSGTQSETDSAIAKGNEEDGVKNYQINLNGIKWINDELKFKSTLYSGKNQG